MARLKLAIMTLYEFHMRVVLLEGWAMMGIAFLRSQISIKDTYYKNLLLQHEIVIDRRSCKMGTESESSLVLMLLLIDLAIVGRQKIPRH